MYYFFIKRTNIIKKLKKYDYLKSIANYYDPNINNKFKQIYEKLIQLTDTELTKDNINNIIGYPYWVKFECDECLQEYDELICLNGEFNEFVICKNCIKKMLDVMGVTNDKINNHNK